MPKLVIDHPGGAGIPVAVFKTDSRFTAREGL